MKLVIVLSIVAFAFARDFDMKLEENGEKFTEQIKVDIAGKTEEIKVPKHGNRPAVDLLNDFKMGYSAMKVIVEKACYISVLEREQTPRQMERSMAVSHAKFPTDSYWVKSEKFIRLYEMTASEVGPKIAAHCAGNDMIFTAKFKKDSDVLKIIKSQSARMKRNAKDVHHVRKFTSCDPNEKYLHCKEQNVHIKCRMLQKSETKCVYNIVCKQDGPYGFKCDGRHNFHLPFCCTQICLP